MTNKIYDDKVIVKFKRLHPHAFIPTQATKLSAGFDVCAVQDELIPPGKTMLIKTGLSVELPEGYELQVRMRSGLALKYGLCITNGIGTIDADYRGEVGVIVHNLQNIAYVVRKGDRIAQFVVQRIPEVEFVESTELSETERGNGGFGSTGK